MCYNSGKIYARLQHSEKMLLDDVSVSLCAGESLALIGETGSGKTMLAMSILRLLPSNVCMREGSVQFCGRELLQERKMEKLLGNEIVYIPQNGLEFLNPSKKVKHHLYDGLRHAGVPRRELRETAIERLKQAGFEQPERIMECYPFQLSGGMAQRVTIALAACGRAKLVIADEPTNGLDWESKKKFMEDLNRMFSSAAKLIITHDIGIASFCDRVMVLCGGKRMEAGPAGDVLERPHHPYTKALMNALVQNDLQATQVFTEQKGECPFLGRCLVCEEKCMTKISHGTDGKTEWWCNHPL